MIGIAAVMMRVRAVHSATMCLLAALAVAAAVAVPRYVEAARASVAQADLDSTPVADTTILSTYDVLGRVNQTDPRLARQAAAERATRFPDRATAALNLPGFTTTLAVGMDMRMSTAPLPVIHDPMRDPVMPEYWLESRDGVCDHLRLLAGRCPVVGGEIMVGQKYGTALGLRPGSTVHVQNMLYHPPEYAPPKDPFWAPDGDMAVFTVVGMYTPPNQTDPFFTGQVDLYRGGDEPVFTIRRTFDGLDHGHEEQRVVGYPTPGALSGAQFADLAPRIRTALQTLNAIRGQPLTAMATVLDKVDSDRRQVGVLPGVLQVPVVLLCCFVIFLAAANTAQARRPELGMLKLRGASAGDQFWLAAGELLVPLAAGGVLGYALGQLAVWLFARSVLAGPTAAIIAPSYLPQAGLALVAVGLAALLGVRRDLVTPVADLLRRVPARPDRSGPIVFRVLVVVIGVAAVVQVHTVDDPLLGVGILAPAAVILGVALILAAAFDPVAAAFGRRALRRGRVGAALAMLHFGRRRTGSRLVALLAVSVGLLGFVAVGFGAGTTARTDQVVASFGAQRVVSVGTISMRGLLTDVRRADPEGRYAMAAMPIGVGAPILAVDSPRLGVVGPWPRQGSSGGLDAAAVASALRPAAGPGVVVTGTDLTVSAAITPQSARSYTRLFVVLAPLDGDVEQYVPLNPARPGGDSYHASVACQRGCRLDTLAILDYLRFVPDDTVFGGVRTIPVTVTLSRIVQSGPDREVVSPAELATWVDRQQAEVTIAGSETGVAATVGEKPGTGLPAWIGPGDAPSQIPIVVPSGSASPPLTVPLPTPVITTELSVVSPVVPVGTVARTPVLPRVGSTGALVDMEYLARIGEPGPYRDGGEVWLGPAAPADAVDRLRAAGVPVLGVRDFDQQLRQAGRGPNATGLDFLVAVGVICLILGAGGLGVGAAADLRARADELRALRWQGTSGWAVTRAGWQSYLAVVASGVLAGGIAAAVAWLAIGSSLPVVDSLVAGVPMPRWPGWTPVAAWVLATAVLCLVGAGLTVTLARATRSWPGRSRR